MSRRYRCFGLLALAVCCSLSLKTPAQEAATRQVLLLGQSPDGHPRWTHEYMSGVELIAKCLASTPDLRVTVVNADDPWDDGPDLLRTSDGMVMFLSEGAKWIHGEPRRLEALAQLAARGGGMVTIHWGMGTRDARYIDGYLKLFGGCHGGPDRKYQVVDRASVQVVDAEHPITRGIRDFQLREEFYYRLKFIDWQMGVQPILRVPIDGNPETVAWAWQRPDGGRSFGFSGGHFHKNWEREEYRRMIVQAIHWTLQLDIPAGGVPVDLSAEDLQLRLPAERSKP